MVFNTHLRTTSAFVLALQAFCSHTTSFLYSHYKPFVATLQAFCSRITNTFVATLQTNYSQLGHG